MVYALAMAAAFLFATGSVIQQRVASEAPPEKTLSIAILLWLVRRKAWLAGIATSLAGNLLAAAALSRGGVALVQPLLNVRLLFALAVVAVLSRVHLAGRDWIGAVTAGVGLALFVVVGRPKVGHALDVSGFDWLLTLAAVSAAVTALLVGAGRLAPPSKATLLGAAAGVLFGLQSSLTQVATKVVTTHGVPALALHWQPYALIGAAVIGGVLIQSAYEMAPLPASYPALATTEPLAGIAIGVAVLGGAVRTAAPAVAAELIGLAVMTAGVYLLATSPLVTGQLEALRRRRDEGMAFRTAARLEKDLAALQRDTTASLDDPPRRRERIMSHLRRAEAEMARLSELRRDMERYSVLEKQHLQALPPRERMLLAPLEEELDRRALEIDEIADRMRHDLDELRRRCRELDGAA